MVNTVLFYSSEHTAILYCAVVVRVFRLLSTHCTSINLQIRVTSGECVIEYFTPMPVDSCHEYISHDKRTKQTSIANTRLIYVELAQARPNYRPVILNLTPAL